MKSKDMIYFLLGISEFLSNTSDSKMELYFFFQSKKGKIFSLAPFSMAFSPLQQHHYLLYRNDELKIIQLRYPCQCWFNKSMLEIKQLIFQNIKQQRSTRRKMRGIEN